MTDWLIPPGFIMLAAAPLASVSFTLNSKDYFGSSRWLL